MDLQAAKQQSTAALEEINETMKNMHNEIRETTEQLQETVKKMQTEIDEAVKQKGDEKKSNFRWSYCKRNNEG